MAKRKEALPGKLWRDAVIRALKRRRNGQKQSLDRLADKLVDIGLEGEVQALKEIGDRVDGRPAQAVELAGKDGGPIQTIDYSKLSDDDLKRLEGIRRALATGGGDQG